jgi:UDP-N-acetylglucosamine acyltransferase
MISPLANVHPEAKIGTNVTIDAFASIEKDVVIGDNTWIGSGAVIHDGSRIGKNCRIDCCAIIGGLPQDLKFKGEYTTVEIGDNTSIREFVTVNRGTASKMKTVIGSNCLIMSYVHIAHDCNIGNNVVLVGYTGLAGEAIVDDWAILEGSCLVNQFVHIGCHTFVAGASKVSKDIPPFVKAAREPLTYVGINSIGMRRRAFTGDKINEIQGIYRYLFQKGLNNSQAVDYIEENMPATAERDEIITFVRGSKRGIMKGYDAGDSDD